MRILITNVKGGVGKSTISANLAYALGASGQKTTLVDLDPHESAGRWIREASRCPNLQAMPLPARPSLGASRRYVIEVRQVLERLSRDGREMVIADLTWNELLDPELFYCFDLVVMPTALSEVELRTTLEFAQRHAWAFKTPGRSPTLVIAPSRVAVDQLSGVGAAFARFQLPMVLTPPILESRQAREAYGASFLIESGDEELRQSFLRFVDGVRQAMHYHQEAHAKMARPSMVQSPSAMSKPMTASVLAAQRLRNLQAAEVPPMPAAPSWSASSWSASAAEAPPSAAPTPTPATSPATSPAAAPEDESKVLRFIPRFLRASGQRSGG